MGEEPAALSFGDNVRVLDTDLTRARGLAGLRGQVYGVTKPSVTGVEVIGDCADDVALNVHFKERGGAFWFDPRLVQFVDHAPGTNVRINGTSFVRKVGGEWVEEKRPWWKFW